MDLKLRKEDHSVRTVRSSTCPHVDVIVLQNRKNKNKKGYTFLTVHKSSGRNEYKKHIREQQRQVQ